MEACIFLSAAALLAIERIGYAWIWHRPRAFRELCRREGFGDPVDVLAAFFCACKALQACVFVAWGIYFGSRTGWPDKWITPAGCLGAASIVVGQILNASVFLRLGRVGVFYGNRLGHRTEWHDGFPFSLLDHPQYVGAVLTIWGFFLLVRHPHEDWVALPLLETVYYALGALAERIPQTEATAADEG